MLDEYIAQKMVNQFSKAIDYNINIMDEKGIIIASGDPERVGTFHESAYQMLTSGRKQMEVYDNQQLMGTKSGVNLALEYRSSVIGVVGVTGKPEDARRVATLLKVAVENLYEFEMRQKDVMAHTTMKDKLFQQLLYFDEPVASDLNHQAAELGYKADCMRIPILIVAGSEQHHNDLASACKSSEQHTKQDMMIRTVDGYPLVFLNLRQAGTGAVSYRSAVEHYLLPIQQAAEAQHIACRFLVGTMQNELRMYHVAYQHCLWLMHNVPSAENTVYFYDHVQDYLQSRVPLSELRDIFRAYTTQEPEKFWNSYIAVIRTMKSNMNNMVKSSKALHMHKNTLVYRYNNIRATLGIDPLNNVSDEDFAYNLCCFLEKDKP